MRRVRRLLLSGAATLGVAVSGVLLAAVPAVAAPEAPETSSPAKSITATTAVLEGVLNPHGSIAARAGWYFIYGTQPVCTEGSTTSRELPVEGHALQERKEVTGLQPSRAYQFCLAAINEAGETEAGNQVSFTTLAVAPKMDRESVVVESTGATLEAEVNPNNQSTNGYFQYSTSAAVNGSGSLSSPTDMPSPPGMALGEGFGDQPLGPVALTGLAAGKTFYYQAVAVNATGTTYGAVQSFTTAPAPAPSPIGMTTATFNGELTLSPGVATRYSFDYNLGSECVNGSSTPVEEAGKGSGTVAEHAAVSDLQPGVEYTVCFVTTNEFGSERGVPVHFTTLPEAPKIDSENVSGVQSAAATLEGQVNPDNEKTSGYFQYSTSATVNGSGSLAGATKTGSSELGEGYGDQSLTAPALAGLAASTTYYYQAVATNATGTTYGPVQQFTTVPTPFTDSVTAVTATTATFNGHFTLGPSVATQFSFDFDPSATECIGGPVTSRVEAGTGSGVVAESTKVTELQPNATYSVCLATSNQFGSEVDQATPLVQFKTLTVPPKVDSESASVVNSVEATLEAQVNPNNQKTSGSLQYSTSPAVNAGGSLTSATNTASGELGEAYGDQPVGPTVLTGLTADQTYYYQAVATNATGTSYGPVKSFTTQGAPLVSAGEAQSITGTTATLSGTVNPAGVETTYHFAYISEAGYQAALAAHAANPYQEGETTASASSSSDEPLTIPPTPISGLQPGTTYHYALIAENTAGLTISPDRTLTTPAPTPPVVSTEGASGISQNGATITGTVTTNGLQTNYGFEIGTVVGEYGAATGLGSIGGANTEAVSLALGELQPGTTYYYRVTATNADGSSYGEPETFTTPGFPTLLAPQVSPPQIAVPAIAFPTDVTESATPSTKTKPKTKPKTKAQKLTAALKRCHRQHKKSRAKCERQAHAKYGPKKKKKRK